MATDKPIPAVAAPGEPNAVEEFVDKLATLYTNKAMASKPDDPETTIEVDAAVASPEQVYTDCEELRGYAQQSTIDALD